MVTTRMKTADYILRWLVGFATALALSLAGWNFLTVFQHESRLTAEEIRSQHVEAWLQRVEEKLDRVLEKR